MATTVTPGREAFSQRAWRDAYEAFSAAARQDDTVLERDDLERLAVAAYLVGEDDPSAEAWGRAHQACLDVDDVDRAVRCAAWLAITLMLRGDMARAGGWLTRAGRLVEEHHPEGSSPGYLILPNTLHALESGEPARADELAAEMENLARAHDDADLLAFALTARGQAAIALGDTATGTTFLDEAMVAVTTGEVSPIPAGIIYCAVILECVGIFDLRRAAEWTETLNRWCEEQPDLVPYRGQCLVHRSQVLQAHGEWAEATTEVEKARERLTQPPHPALGLACYQRGELHRLRGEFADAEEAYRQASRHGHEPLPGLPLLRLAQGKTDAAVGAIRRALDETEPPLDRLRLLAAAVEIFLGAGDLAAAAERASELNDLADTYDAPLVRAMAAHAAGTVRLAEDDASSALRLLRAAEAVWRELETPYESARTRMEIGRACQALGDHDTADLELDAARATFERLHAEPALDALGRVAEPARSAAGDLTARECEVLRLVAAGRTNRQIADALVISEHTVARHVQNIFAKVGVSSRSAATAYAYEHDLA